MADYESYLFHCEKAKALLRGLLEFVPEEDRKFLFEDFLIFIEEIKQDENYTSLSNEKGGITEGDIEEFCAVELANHILSIAFCEKPNQED